MRTSKRDTVQEAFETYERAIRVSDSQNREAKRVQSLVREQIEERMGDLCVETFLSGSYRRKTQIAPLEDIDIVVVSALDPAPPASETLAGMAAIALHCPIVRRVEPPGVRAVTCVVEGSPIKVDLVPARERDDLKDDRLWLCCHKPAAGLDTWTLAPPRGQIRAGVAKNAETAGDFIRITRVAKHVNCIQPRDADGRKPLPSYAIEAAVHTVLDGPSDYAPALAKALAMLERCLVNRAPLPDPGHRGDDVLEMLDDDRRARAIPIIHNLAAQAARALGLPADEALVVWAEVCGGSFPSAANRTGTMAAGAGAGTLGGFGASVGIVPASAAVKRLPSWRP